MSDATKYDRLRSTIADAASAIDAAQEWTNDVSDLTPLDRFPLIESHLVRAQAAISDARAACGECEEEGR